MTAIKDESEQRRGEVFAEACRHLVGTLYAGDVEKVWLWKDWPGRWRDADNGIDLVAETRQGGLWAIQAKCYAETSPIKKSDIDSFLSESSRDGFEFRLLIATTDTLGSNARQVLAGQAVAASSLLRADLEGLHFDWSPALEGAEPRRVPLAPRPASAAAVAAVTGGLAEGGRGQLHMACGTGKTLVGLWSSEALQASRTLVLLPSLSLLGQTLREWQANGSIPRRFLAVCSDPTVTSDEARLHTHELGVPVTTCAADVETFLAGQGDSVVLCTYQSGSVVAEACQATGVAFDLVIADEAHRCAGRGSALYGLVLDDQQIPAARKLFMTATPRIFTANVKRRAAEQEVQVTSMDDTDLFGPVLHSLTFGDAIRDGLLSDYRVVIVGIDDASLDRDITRRTLVLPEGSDEVTDAETLAGLVVVARAIPELGLRRLVTFHGRVAAAKNFAGSLPWVANWLEQPTEVSASFVSGAMPASRRLVRLQQLAQGTLERPYVLANARCLSEGINVPNLDGVAFMDPRESQVDIVQAVGRAIRLAPDKRVGTIVLPIYLGPAVGMEAVEASRFATIARVIRALRAHDITLAEELDSIRQEIGKRGGTPRLPARIVLDLPATVTPAFFEALKLRIVESSTSSFELYLGAMRRFIAENGHGVPRIDFEQDGLPLGRWASAQRAAGKNGTLSRRSREALDAVDGWVWDPLAVKWEVGFRHLLHFIESHGHASPSQTLVWEGYPLGRWVGTCRRSRAKGTLAASAVERLNSLDSWTWNVRGARLDQYLEGVARYYAREGHLKVPFDDREDSVAVGAWLTTQRRLARRGQLRAGVQEALDAISPTWRVGARGAAPTPRPDLALWSSQLAKVLEAYGALGADAYKQNCVYQGFRTGAWLTAQRSARKRSALSQGQAQALADLPEFSLDPLADEWFKRLELLRAYAASHGTCRVKRAHDVALNVWAGNQIRAARDGTIAPARLALLEAIPQWADAMPRRGQPQSSES